MSVCCTVSDIFSVKEWRDLEIEGRGRSRLLKMAPFDRSYTTFYWCDSVKISIAVCCTISTYLTLNNRDLKKVTKGHSNWYYSKAWVRFSIRLP